MRLVGPVLVLCAGFTACMQMASFTPNGLAARETGAASEVLAVLPVSGNAALRRGAGEWLAHKLQVSARYRVLSPGTVEMRLPSGADLEERDIDAPEARRLGAALGARIVVVGEVTTTAAARIRVTVFDVSGGEQFTRSSVPRGFAENANGLYPTAVTGVEEVAQSLLAELAARNARESAAASGRVP